MEGWKTKAGALLIFLSSLCFAGEQAFPIEEYKPWFHFFSIALSGSGAGLGLMGIGHKLDKTKENLVQSVQPLIK